LDLTSLSLPGDIVHYFLLNYQLQIRAGPSANFVGWAAYWLSEQWPQIPSEWQNSTCPKVHGP